MDDSAGIGNELCACPGVGVAVRVKGGGGGGGAGREAAGVDVAGAAGDAVNNGAGTVGRQVEIIAGLLKGAIKMNRCVVRGRKRVRRGDAARAAIDDVAVKDK